MFSSPRRLDKAFACLLVSLSVCLFCKYLISWRRAARTDKDKAPPNGQVISLSSHSFSLSHNIFLSLLSSCLSYLRSSCTKLRVASYTLFCLNKKPKQVNLSQRFNMIMRCILLRVPPLSFSFFLMILFIPTKKICSYLLLFFPILQVMSLSQEGLLEVLKTS